MIRAAITPGIQPAMVSKRTISTEPHPLSKTAKGGKMMDRRTLKHDISIGIINGLCGQRYIKQAEMPNIFWQILGEAGVCNVFCMVGRMPAGICVLVSGKFFRVSIAGVTHFSVFPKVTRCVRTGRIPKRISEYKPDVDQEIYFFSEI